MTKICRICNVEKLQDAYRYGYRECRACTAAKQRARLNDPEYRKRENERSMRYKLRNLERIRKQQREATRSRRHALSREDVRKINERRKHTDTYIASRKVIAAVYYGKLQKPTTCTDCKQEFPKARIHGHHEDYSKPLEVIWVCHVCHMKRHGRWAEPLVEAQA